MAARTTLTGLIARLRLLISDPAGVGQAWSDDQLQTFLDDLQRRANVDYFALTPAGNFAAGVTINRLIYSAPCGDWEAATLYNQSNVALSPSSADLNQGRWTFASDVPRRSTSSERASTFTARRRTCFVPVLPRAPRNSTSKPTIRNSNARRNRRACGPRFSNTTRGRRGGPAAQWLVVPEMLDSGS